jgi:hypothetical protein
LCFDQALDALKRVQKAFESKQKAEQKTAFDGLSVIIKSPEFN